MMLSSIRLVSSLLLVVVSAVPIELEERQDNNTVDLLPYSVPSGTQPLRADAITIKQETFIYGPAIGAGPYYPNGTLGATYDATDVAAEGVELTAQGTVMNTDLAKASLDFAKYNGLKTLDDYTKLYDNEWVKSSSPTGQAPGILTNYTQDLLFSMERLSVSPYAVRRLMPGQDTPTFAVSDTIVQNLTGTTLDGLFQAGRLFYADHRNQSTLTHNPGKYTANCDAYFYICPTTGDFLPLAIRTNFGSNLIYTPADEANDWLLAKMMYNVNDFWMNQWDHFARNHFAAEIVYMAAVRTLSDSHPVLAILDRLLYAAFSIRPGGLLILLRPGGYIDQLFAYTGADAAKYTDQTYFNGFSGAVHANYFLPNLRSRYLIDSPLGPPLKSFPFYEDACPIFDAIHAFTTAFVASYYPTTSSILADNELQAWVTEAQGPAEVIDFPTIQTPADLAQLLAEIARLVSISHHTQNTNSLITASSVFPFHSPALYKQIPTAKGQVDNPADWLPKVNQSLNTIMGSALFSRPLLANTNRSLINMFNDPIMLGRMNAATQEANSVLMANLTARSAVVKSRTFDEEGLSQGMPFVWQALDPGVAPWSLTI